MKKIHLYILLIFFLFFPLNVKAYTRLRASNQVPVIGDSITISLEINYGKELKVSEAHYIITYDTNFLEYDSIRWVQSTETLDTSTPGKIYIDKSSANPEWLYGDVVIIKMNVVAAGKTKVHLETNGQAYFTTGNAIQQTTSDVTLNTKQPDTQTTIGTLYVEGYAMSPTFNQNRYEYKLTVPPDVESVNVVAKAKNNKQTITGDGVRNLIYGDNLVKVTVTAQNGSSSTYRIMIKREDNRSANATLSSLDISNTEIRLEEGKYTYDTEVSKSIDTVFISAIPVDAKATITGTGEKKLEFGLNTFELTVQSSEGTTQIYTFNITRSTIEFQSSNTGTNLLSLKANDKSFDVLKNDKFLYLLKEIPIEAIPQSSTAKVQITGNNKIENGPNTITITVSESTGEFKEYKIYVYKMPSSFREITSMDISFDAIVEDIYFLENINTEEKIIPKEIIRSTKSKKFVFNYGITNDDGALLYLFKITSDQKEEDINVIVNKLEDKILPTFQVEIPTQIETTIYVGDLYDDNTIVKIYSYNEEGNYFEVTSGSLVAGGYVTFVTNGHKYFIVTTETLINVEKDFMDYVEEYKEYIAYGFAGLLILVILNKFRQYLKIRKARKI